MRVLSLLELHASQAGHRLQVVRLRQNRRGVTLFGFARLSQIAIQIAEVEVGLGQLRVQRQARR